MSKTAARKRYVIDRTALRAAVDRRGLSQSEISRQSGVARSFISRLILGKARACNNNVLARLARALEVRAESLINRSEPIGTRTDQFRSTAQLHSVALAFKAIGACGASTAPARKRYAVNTEALRAAVVRRGLSQSEVAKRAGVARPFLNRLVRGDARACGADFLARIARELGVSAESLIDRRAPKGTRTDQFRPTAELEAIAQASEPLGAQYALERVLPLILDPDAWRHLLLEPIATSDSTLALEFDPISPARSRHRRQVAQGIAALVSSLLDPVAAGERSLAPHATAACAVASSLWSFLFAVACFTQIRARRDRARALASNVRTSDQSEEAFNLALRREVTSAAVHRTALAAALQRLDEEVAEVQL